MQWIGFVRPPGIRRLGIAMVLGWVVSSCRFSRDMPEGQSLLSTGGLPGEEETSTGSNPMRLDVGGVEEGSTGEAGPCVCAMGSEFSFLWVANSEAGTLSKIDTEQVTEVGRYLTRPDGEGDPSRTSVSISGRAVAVANRRGGLTAVWAHESLCEDRNENGTIDTSRGPAEVLPWGEDECVAWHEPFEAWTVQRPVAWAPGRLNETSCTWEDETIWTAGCGGGVRPSTGDAMATEVRRVDGATGKVIAELQISGYPCRGFGPYGAAVDADGNLWLVQNNGDLASVNADTLATQVHRKPDELVPYGIMVDAKGRPWVTSYNISSRLVPRLARLSPDTGEWHTVRDLRLSSHEQSGLAQGSDGRVWVAGSFIGLNGVAGVDPESLQVTNLWDAVGSEGKGVSVDGQGFVWRAGGFTATRIDPDDGSSHSYVGLEGAYTYSDMTGVGVANVRGCVPVR